MVLVCYGTDCIWKGLSTPDTKEAEAQLRSSDLSFSADFPAQNFGLRLLIGLSPSSNIRSSHIKLGYTRIYSKGVRVLGGGLEARDPALVITICLRNSE